MKYIDHPERTFRHLISAPFIYCMIFPVLILDICSEIYHRVCFKLYGIDYVKRGQYIRIDRQKLSKLNSIQKINCMYCGYVNGVFHYVSVIGGETEKYWCAIKHQEHQDFKPPEHHEDFEDYADYL